jgi:HD-GYP domain-containing protein (c-di-GMP phosphodiesterase class II)
MPEVTPAAHATLTRWTAWQALADRLEPLLLRPGSAADFTGELDAIVSELIQLMREDDDLGVFEVVRISADKLPRYGVLHSLHTAVVVALIGRRKEWFESQLRSAVSAALTMNLSVTALQTLLAQHPGAMSPDQQGQIREHPQQSVQMLRVLGVQDEEWLTAVAQHHEQPGGKGYPQGLETMSELADVIRTADVFCAKMSPRAGRTAMLSPTAAAAIFRQRSAGYFGATVVSELGLYPPGCLVGLASGESALVVQRTRDPHRPRVALLTDTDGQALPEPQASATGKALGRGVVGAAPDASLAKLFPPEQILSTL